MVKTIIGLLFFASFKLSAAIYTGTISHIDMPRNDKELPLIFLSNGSVLKISNENKIDIAAFQEAKRSVLKLKLEVNKKQQILAVENLGKEKNVLLFEQEALSDFEPTVLATEADVTKIFSTLKKGAKSWSQCYNRAHIWSYESKVKHGLDSMKVFLFYTRKYIREYNFDWWFHVSPFTYVAGVNGIEERVLDYRFTKSPLPMKKWTDVFMHNKSECTPIVKFSDYENNQEQAYCYLYRASMYYYQPLDLEALENTGAQKLNWVKWEVNNAYRNGFRFW